jgi:diguanylate cyclase (GGDEF)-like protein
LLRLTRHADSAPLADPAPYEEDVTRALSKGFRWMYFPARLEQLFEQETRHARSRHLVAVGILWIVLGALYAIMQAVSPGGRGTLGVDVAVRIGIVTPVLIGVTVAIWWGVRPFVRELLMMLVNIIAPVSMILVVTFAYGGDVGANRGALTIALLFITVVVRLRFWYATAACLAIVAVQVGVPSVMNVPVPGSVPLALITIAATLTANYTLEREYRLNYLHRVQSRIQGAQLATMVDQLHDLSQRDALTGLANRRALDAQLEELYQGDEQFAVILVDIDGFKAFNDSYGHQIGDDCLRRVAAMLRASLRFTADRIARMGGEEFAVVLPGTSLDDARIIAERMRNSVHALQIPHAASPTGQFVTISAGVSASAGRTLPGEVISEADRALYRAKSLGRDRVEVARGDLDEQFQPGSRQAVPV